MAEGCNSSQLAGVSQGVGVQGARPVGPVGLGLLPAGGGGDVLHVVVMMLGVVDHLVVHHLGLGELEDYHGA